MRRDVFLRTRRLQLAYDLAVEKWKIELPILEHWDVYEIASRNQQIRNHLSFEIKRLNKFKNMCDFKRWGIYDD